MRSGNKSGKDSRADKFPREKQALFLLSMYFHRYLVTVYGDEDLDLLSISLLNEIAQHNLEPFVKKGHLGFPRNAEEMKRMQGCNAFSLSQATGIPRETARRKIKQLTALGWVEQRNRKGLFVTAHWMERLSGEETSELLAEFKKAAGQVEQLLAP